jgi:hypothetical protein
VIVGEKLLLSFSGEPLDAASTVNQLFLKTSDCVFEDCAHQGNFSPCGI